MQTPSCVPARRVARRLRAGLAGVALAAVAVGLLPASAALAAPASAASAASAAREAGHPAARPASAHQVPGPGPMVSRGVRAACGKPAPGHAQCFALVRTNIKAPRVSATGKITPAGYGPADLRSAYKLPSGPAGAGQTVAIVDAYDDPNAAADLAVYRAQYGLPPCTVASGCFRKVAQDGSANYPQPDAGWIGEISLDLDMVSATCPKCHILLVEANSASVADLGAAVDEAVALGAKYVSNSYGLYVSDADASWQARDDQLYYNHPGVAVTAASGDSSYGVSYPAASPDVVAVGGTTLSRDTSAKRGWTETAWSYGGSGCSASEPKPAWQHDQGCPHRTVADVSAVADPNTGVAVYDSYSSLVFLDGPGWQEFGGTSAASPIIASAYALAGTPSPVASPASYPYADPSALNDVTSGSNSYSGCSPAYLCTAGPGYDGPTGLGTPDGVQAFRYGVHGPHGDLAGTVTSAAGKPIAGAQVSAGGYTAVTDASGHYDLAVAPGTVSVTAAAFGYAAKTVPGVTVTAGQTQAENFALATVAMRTVSGTVSDRSGHGWPLYAQVSAAGTPVVTYTDPATGRYTLKLPAGASYTLQASPVSAGYAQGSRQVSVGSAGVTADIAVPVDDGAGCTAPGYHVTAGGFFEGFSKRTIPPGWSIVNLPGDGPGNTWRFDQPDGYPNETGGSGNYAVAFDTSNGGYQADTELVTPVINMSADRVPQLQFDSFIQTSIISESVDVSTDGGSTWSTAWSNAGFAGAQITVPLPQAAGQASVRLRFHMTEPVDAGGGDTEWQVDNVDVTDCSPASGGLVTGTVANANTGQGVDGATITGGQPGLTATSGPVPGDPRHSHGFYSMFAPAGRYQLTAAAPGYATGSAPVTVTADKVSTAGLALTAGQVAVSGGPVTGRATLGGGPVTATVTVRNTGSAPATVSLEPRPGGFTPAGPSAARDRTASGGYPVRLAPVRLGPRPGLPAALSGISAGRRAGAAAPAWADNSPWVRLAQMPGPLALAGVAGAVDPVTGKVYAAGGEADFSRQSSAVSVFDPAANRWSALRPMSHQRTFASAAFIGGKLYVTGGVYSAYEAGVPQTEIYNPASDTWTQGAPVPHPYGTAATVVLNGKMYLLGGCSNVRCATTDVQVYNPAANRWSAAAAYPAPVEGASCGAIAGKIYCVGGVTPTSVTSAGYAYDPATNNWAPIASLPAVTAFAGYGVSDGELLVSGGLTVQGGNFYLTNQGYAYDPVTNSWSALPNQPQAEDVPGSACGFYVFGGSSPGPSGATWQLPGYGGCGGQGWLTATPATTTLAPGQAATVKVTLNAADPSVTVPGTYTASFRVGNDTPYGPPTVPVTFTVKPPKTWGQLAGTVKGTTCAGTTGPLAGATVQISAAKSTYTPTTDTAGHYGQWLPRASKVSVIASLAGWQPQAATVSVPAGTTTTRNFTLKQICG